MKSLSSIQKIGVSTFVAGVATLCMMLPASAQTANPDATSPDSGTTTTTPYDAAEDDGDTDWGWLGLLGLLGLAGLARKPQERTQYRDPYADPTLDPSNPTATRSDLRR
jgi:MYXO-CTERM domain-containing protein